MYTRYLKTLDHPTPDSINFNDPKDFRNTVLWLEDQKIRHYPIEDRVSLRKVNSPDEWNVAYEKYKIDLKIPAELTAKNEQLTFLMLYAIKLEYMDNFEKYSGTTAASVSQKKISSAPSIKSTNPFDNLDFHSQEFEFAVRDLADKLNIPYHPDHILTLSAINRVIKNYLSKEALKDPIIKGKPYPIDEEGNGMGFEDEDLERASRILRLLQIQSVRKLQTAINETIVSVQNLTADPKTDTKLGKVGF